MTFPSMLPTSIGLSSPVFSREYDYSLFDGRTLCVKCWEHREAVAPIDASSVGMTLILLHGWLDNAGSFDVLAPLLIRSNRGIQACIALDLAGHGQSDHRGDFLPYTLWDDALDVCAFIKGLGLQSAVLVGHSRGAMVASLAASVLEDQVSHLLLLDGAWPEPQRESDIAITLKKALNQRLSEPKKATRFPSRSKAIEARAKSRFSVSMAAAELLAERGLVMEKGAYLWQADQKLHLLGGVKLSLKALQMLSQNISANVHLWVAEQGVLLGETAKPMLHSIFPQLNVHDIEGNHHFHMDDAIVNLLADEILQVLEAG